MGCRSDEAVPAHAYYLDSLRATTIKVERCRGAVLSLHQHVGIVATAAQGWSDSTLSRSLCSFDDASEHGAVSCSRKRVASWHLDAGPNPGIDRMAQPIPRGRRADRLVRPCGHREHYVAADESYDGAKTHPLRFAARTINSMTTCDPRCWRCAMDSGGPTPLLRPGSPVLR